MDIILDAYIPIRDFSKYPWKQGSLFEEAFKHFTNTSPEIAQEIDESVEISEIRFADPPKKAANRLMAINTIALCQYFPAFKIRARVYIDVDKFKAENDNDPDVEKYLYAEATIRLTTVIDALLLISELSRPGLIDTLEGVACYEGDDVIEIKRKPAYRFLSRPYDEEAEYENYTWPEIQTLDMRKVFEWVKSINYFQNSFAKSRSEKLFASFTHLIGLSEFRDGEVLFRSMQGLEAFYCDGIGDLRKQLSDKSQIYLGDWENNKNIVGQLYDVRSKFIHGSSDIVYWNQFGDPYEENERLMHQINSGVALSVRIVVSTLQKLIVQNITEISWSYKMNTTESANKELNAHRLKAGG